MKWLLLTLSLVTAPQATVTLHELVKLPGVIPLWASPECKDTQGLLSFANASGTFTCAMFGLASTGIDTVHMAMGAPGGDLKTSVLALFTCSRVPQTTDEVDCESIDPDVFYARHSKSI